MSRVSAFVFYARACDVFGDAHAMPREGRIGGVQVRRGPETSRESNHGLEVPFPTIMIEYSCRELD